MKAIAFWNPDKKSKYSFSKEKLKGFVLLIQKEDCVKVNIFVEGLPDGNHGIHIHEKSLSEIYDLEDANCCDQLGGHYNNEESWSLTEPNGTKHGHHSGDMCLNISSKNGLVNHTYFDKKFRLKDVLDRTIVIHEDEDDGGCGLYLDEEKNVQSLVTGNAGERLACAQIRLITDKNF